MKSVPCGCRVELNSRGEAMGFSRECSEAQRMFTRLMRKSSTAPVSAELKRHIAKQL